MGPSGALASTWLRRNIIATVTLVVLVALASGAMSGSVAAARRSSSALDRFLEFNRPSTAVLTGVPLGLVVGRLGWAALAEGIGSPTPAIVPVSWTLAGIIVVVLVANLVGAIPAGRARRVRPAETLRTE